MASRQNKRKSSTFVQRTNAHFKAIERQINPQPRFGSLEGDPPAVTNSGKFIDRVVIVDPGTDKLTIGAICRALKSSGVTGSGPTGDFYIRKIKIWGLPSAGTNNYVAAKFYPGALTVAGHASGAADPIVVQDYGTASRLPGVYCSIPLPAAILQNFDTASTINVADLNPTFSCIHVSVRQKL